MDFNEKQIAPPKFWEQFEELCLALFRALWGDTYAQKNGRRGQPQAGVDVYGTPVVGSLHGVQCKGKDALYGKAVTLEEFESEVAKAETFKPALAKFILASTCVRDSKLQEHVRLISRDRAVAGKFEVNILAWEDIQSLLATQPQVIERYYPEHSYDISALTQAVKTLVSATPPRSGLSRALHNECSWVDVEFDDVRDLGPALMGRALGPNDAAACPRLEECDVLLQHLQIAFSARLVGPPGSGKTVCAYQVARELSGQEWRVLKLEGGIGQLPRLASTEDKRTLHLIDDAHLFSEEQLRQLEAQANARRVILSIHSDLQQSSRHRGCVQLDGKRAVRTIAAVLRSDEAGTLRIVQSVDDRVGLNMLDEDFAHRLDNAEATAEFPWQFCFILGGGWRRTKLAADNARLNNSDLILAITAARQLIYRDAKCSVSDIVELTQDSGIDEKQTTEALSWLVNERLLLSHSDLRCPHQRFSGAVIGQIYTNLETDRRRYFRQVCAALVLRRDVTLAGCQALINQLLFTASHLRWGHELSRERLFDEPVFDALMERCWAGAASEDQAYGSFIIADLLTKETADAILTQSRRTVLAGWINNADPNNAYGVARLFGSIAYQWPNIAADIFAEVTPQALAKRLSTTPLSSSHGLLDLVGSLHLWDSEDRRSHFLGALDKQKLIDAASEAAKSDGIWIVSKLCSTLGWIDEDFGFNLVAAASPKFRAGLDSDPVSVFHDMESVLQSFLMIWHPLGREGMPRADSRRVDTARSILSALDPGRTADAISKCSRRDFQNATFLLAYLHQVLPRLAEKIRNALDWNQIETTIGSQWANLTHESNIFLSEAGRGKVSRTKASASVMKNVHKIQSLSTRVAYLDAAIPIAVLENGGRVNLAHDMTFHWGLAAFVLHAVAVKRPELAAKMVEPHEQRATESFQRNQLNTWDDAHWFVAALHECAPASLQRILGNLDTSAAESTWAACLEHGGKPRRAAALLVEYSLGTDAPIKASAQRLRKKFPRTSVPKRSRSRTSGTA